MIRRHRYIASVAAAVLAASAGVALGDSTGSTEAPPATTTPTTTPVALPPVALGVPWCGHLLRGVALPQDGAGFFTWDVPFARSPNRYWRRYGTTRLLAVIESVSTAYALAHPGYARVGVADLSRIGGGPFGRHFGGLGHASHQNGLDVDILYPRRDRSERPVHFVSEIDLPAAQDLLNRFLAAGAQYVFIGYRVGTRGPWPRVQRIANHEDHMHVRIPPLHAVRAPLRCPWRPT
jgi:murein endopeptidase